jgi:hypothetical protein
MDRVVLATYPEQFTGFSDQWVQYQRMHRDIKANHKHYRPKHPYCVNTAFIYKYERLSRRPGTLTSTVTYLGWVLRRLPQAIAARPRKPRRLREPSKVPRDARFGGFSMADSDSKDGSKTPSPPGPTLLEPQTRARLREIHSSNTVFPDLRMLLTKENGSLPYSSASSGV